MMLDQGDVRYQSSLSHSALMLESIKRQEAFIVSVPILSTVWCDDLPFSVWRNRADNTAENLNLKDSPDSLLGIRSIASEENQIDVRSAMATDRADEGGHEMIRSIKIITHDVIHFHNISIELWPKASLTRIFTRLTNSFVTWHWFIDCKID